MSYENFKPIIWSKYIQQEVEKRSKLVDFCNRQFEGEAKLGKMVRILNAVSPTIYNYDQATGLETPETFEGTYRDLVVDQAKAFNFMIDDIDRIQANPELFGIILEEAGRKMSEQRERFVASLAVGVAEENIVPSQQIKTPAQAKAAVDAALLILRDNDVALEDNVHIEVSPFFYQFFRDAIVEMKTDNVDIINRGIVGRYDNAMVVLSTCLHNDGTDDYCMVRTKKSIAFASAIDETEAYRPEKYFSDAVKGLNVYGGKIVRPKELAVIKAHK